MPLRLPEYLDRLRAYVPGKPIDEVRQEFGITEIVKLASNENPLGASPLAMAAIIDQSRFVSLYPDAGCVQIKNALSEKLGMSAENLVMGNGSDEMIHFLSGILLRPGAYIVMGDPGFSRYESEATAAGAEARKVKLDANARHELTAMATAIDNNTAIVWIANPNNPTGTIIRKKEFESFLERVPDHVLVVLDEAYFEFADDPEYPNSAEFVRLGKNVVGLRTFSNTYGLAGLRIGYAICTTEIASALEKIREPFNVNFIAQVAALAALSDSGHLQETVELNRRGVAQLTELMQSYGCTVSESFANFVWCNLQHPADPLANALLKQGVIVRPGSVFGCPNHLRVSVGTDAEIDRLRAALRAVGHSASTV
jgi:histidinol-phosphate aminotransferase